MLDLNSEFLNIYASDYSYSVKSQGDRNIFGRHSEVAQIIVEMQDPFVKNVLLVGDRGTGKSTILFKVAKKLQSDSIPLTYTGKKILKLNLNELKEDIFFKRDYMNGMSELLYTLRSNTNRLYLLIDDINHAVGIRPQTGDNIVIQNITKLMVHDQKINILATCDSDAYYRLQQDDPEFLSNFKVVKIPEFNVLETINILFTMRDYFYNRYQIDIEESAIITAVRLAEKYMPEQRFPEKAIRIINKACLKRNFVVEGKNLILEAHLDDIKDMQKGIANLNKNKNPENDQYVSFHQNVFTQQLHYKSQSINQLESSILSEGDVPTDSFRKTVNSDDIKLVVSEIKGIHFANLAN